MGWPGGSTLGGEAALRSNDPGFQEEGRTGAKTQQRHKNLDDRRG